MPVDRRDHQRSGLVARARLINISSVVEQCANCLDVSLTGGVEKRCESAHRHRRDDGFVVILWLLAATSALALSLSLTLRVWRCCRLCRGSRLAGLRQSAKPDASLWRLPN